MVGMDYGLTAVLTGDLEAVGKVKVGRRSDGKIVFEIVLGNSLSWRVGKK